MQGRLAGWICGLACLAGCVSVTPYEDLVATLPADRLLDVDGRRVYVEDRGQGEPVVLVHGFGASSYCWRYVADDLAKDFRVVTLDLAGFGFTERPRRKADYTRYAQGELVLGVARELGLERFHLVGHSYGAAVSVALAVRAPQRILSLTLVDAAAPDYPLDRRSVAASFQPLTTLFVRLKSLRRGNVERSLEGTVADPATVTAEMVDEYRRRLTVEGAARGFWGLTAPVADPQGRVSLADLDVATLVVWGARDLLIPVAEARRATAVMAQYRFVVIADAGHAVMEDRPAEFASLLRRFLRGGLAAFD
jgi:pimeloyl-ACP methyl ester carboxylesterase